jgi:CheY-like chemotaxis protein
MYQETARLRTLRGDGGLHGFAPTSQHTLLLRNKIALVVDDEQDSRDALAILLRMEGLVVHAAADGDEGLRFAREYLPELIFLDIGMPGRTGYEVCRELRQSSAFEATRIFALSGFSGETHVTRCSEAGFTACFTKPMDPSVLQRLARDCDHLHS